MKGKTRWKLKKNKRKKKNKGKDVDDMVHEEKTSNTFSCYRFKGFDSYLLGLVSNSN